MAEKLTKRIHPGRRKKHGAYSYLASGQVPESRRYIEKYLSAAREQLIKDLGPTEQDLTAAQIIIIDRVITKLGIIRLIEEYCREKQEIFQGSSGRLLPALSNNYLAYNNSVRLDLQSLGINKRVEEIINPIDYIQGKGKRNK